jgi:hypothetical protein
MISRTSLPGETMIPPILDFSTILVFWSINAL